MNKQIRKILEVGESKSSKAKKITEIIRQFGNYRWVGIYDVTEEEIVNIAWSGPSAPTFLHFPKAKGLSGAAVLSREIVVSNDVSQDPRYLTALSTTKSEIIVPVINELGDAVGTIDVESEKLNAFDEKTCLKLKHLARIILPLWS